MNRTGVDYVSLHHYFNPEIRPLDINTFGKTVYDIRNWHDLPFDYRCFRLGGGEFDPAQIFPQKADPGELRERANGVDFRPGNPNPLLGDDSKKEVDRARQYIKRVLDIPD